MGKKFRKITEIIDEMKMTIDEGMSEYPEGKIREYLDDLGQDIVDLETRLDDIRMVL